MLMQMYNSLTDCLCIYFEYPGGSVQVKVYA